MTGTIKAEPKFYYLKREAEYLHWTGCVFTDDEAGAWLGTSQSLDLFRSRHSLARAPGVVVVTAVSAPAAVEA